MGGVTGIPVSYLSFSSRLLQGYCKLLPEQQLLEAVQVGQVRHACSLSWNPKPQNKPFKDPDECSTAIC